MIPPTNDVALAAAGNSSAADELEKYLHKKTSEQDRGTSSSQQNQVFINTLKKYSDNLESFQPLINEYIADQGGKEAYSTDNPKLPAPDQSLTQGSVPNGPTGKGNPFFDPSPMATFFTEFLALIKMQGQLAMEQTKSSINDSKLTMALGQDQATSIKNEAEIESQSLTKQAGLDFAMAGVSFAGAAGQLFAGLKMASGSREEIQAAEKSVENAADKLKAAEKFSSNTEKTDQITEKQDLLAKQLDGKKADPHLKQGQLMLEQQTKASAKKNAQKVADEAEESAQKVKQDTIKLKATKTESVDETEDAATIQKNMKSKKEKHDELGKQIENKKETVARLKTIAQKNKDEVTELETQIKANPLNKKKLESHLINKKSVLQRSEDELKLQKGNLSVAEMKQKGLAAEMKADEYRLELIKPTNPANLKKLENEARNASTEVRGSINERLSKASLDEKAELLGIKDSIYTSDLKRIKDKNTKIKMLTKQKENLDEQKVTITQLRDKARADFKKALDENSKITGQSVAKNEEELDLLEKNPTKIIKDAQDDLAKRKSRVDQLKQDKVNLDSSWKYKVFEGVIGSINGGLRGGQKLVEAQGKLDASQWTARKTLDQTYQQMMQMAMQAQADAAKGSFDAGAQYAQALMGMSDKEVNTVHWAA